MPGEAQLRHKASSLGVDIHLSGLTAATFPGRCLSIFPAGMGRKQNFIISLALALLIGSLELSPRHSLGTVKVRRLKTRWLQKATAGWLLVLRSW